MRPRFGKRKRALGGYHGHRDGYEESRGEPAPLAEARYDLAAIVHEVEQGTHVEVTRRGAPVAVIVPIADYVGAEKGKDFWKAYLEWRKGVDLRKLRIGRSFMKGMHDRSPGRDFNW